MQFVGSISARLKGRSESRTRTVCQASAGSSSPGLPTPGAVASFVLAAGLLGYASRRMALPTVLPVPSRRVVISSDAENSVHVVLSSGFLSFANHSGFLKAIEEAGLKVQGVMGTSAGALSGALYAAGYTPQQIAMELSRNPPAHYLQISNAPWEGGILNMSKAVQRYRELLPPTFEDLPIDFAVGVYTRDGKYQVVDSGPLPEAVVASAAIPFVFENVRVPGVGHCMDGGKYDRVGLEGWRERCLLKGIEMRPAFVHLISRSSPFSGREEVLEEEDVIVVRSPKSGVSFTSLGNFEEQFTAAYNRASAVISNCEFRVEV